MRAGHHDKLPTHPLTKGNAMFDHDPMICFKCNKHIDFGYFLDNPDGSSLYWCTTCAPNIDWDMEDKAGRM
jgi:hypothetical protein